MVSTRTKVLSVRLPNEVADQLILAARILETTPSQLMTKIIVDWFVKNGHFKEEKPH